MISSIEVYVGLGAGLQNAFLSAPGLTAQNQLLSHMHAVILIAPGETVVRSCQMMQESYSGPRRMCTEGGRDRTDIDYTTHMVVITITPFCHFPSVKAPAH